jgi:monothiol glutaredoxin
METIEKIKQQLAENPIILYMKGSPKLPSCGFSAQASQALMSCGEPFAYVDILQNPDIRAELPKIRQLATFPQLWVEGRAGRWLRHHDRDVPGRRAADPDQETAAKHKQDDAAAE